MKKILIIISFLITGMLETKAQAFEWAKRFDSPYRGFEGSQDVSICSDGNSIVFSAFFKDSIRIGNQVYYHNGTDYPNDNYNSYLVKYDLGGSILWSKHIKGSRISNVNVAVDAGQNIIVTGLFKDSLTIGTRIFTRPGISIFIVKLDPGGNILWSRSSESPSLPIREESRWLKSDIDLAGNLYMTGVYNGSIKFNNSTITTSNNGSGWYTGFFLLKYNANGTLQWLNDLGNPNGAKANIAVTDQGDIFSVNSNYYSTGTLYKYNSNGILQWTRNTPQSPFGQEVTAIGIDKSGNAYLAGAYAASITLGSINLPSNTATPFKPTYFITKIDKSGLWKWVTEIENTSYTRLKLPKKINKTFSIAGDFSSTLNVGDSTFTNGPTFIAKMDTLGSILQIRRITTKNGYWNLVETIAMDPDGNTYLAGSYQNNVTIGSFKLNTIGATYTSRFLTKLQNYSNALTGTVFRDTNANGIKDAGEQPFTERILEITPGPIFVNTLSNGNYGTYLPAGNFNISIPNPPRHYTVAPASHSFAFSGLNQSLGGKDFALQPIPNSPDVKITLTPRTPARPGFNLFYTLTFTNVGTTVLSDSLDLTFNAGLLTFQSASVAPVVQQTGKLKWTYQNLQPTEKRSINILMYLDSTAIIGNPLQTIAAIKPLVTDLFPRDNYDTLNQVITASFDPNDKLVNFEKLTPAEVSIGKALDYTIRFQNTGTDTAFTIIVRDVFSKNLDLTSFEVLAASHPYSFRLLNNGNAEWRLDNIMLPDKNRDEPASHGFIRYRMKPKTNLVLGDEIKGNAAIYFDFNAPVITNYAITRVANPTGINAAKASQPFQLYPNPAQNYVMVAGELKKPTAANIKLVNMLGQLISEVTLPANNQIHYQLPLNNLPKGIYLVQLETENGRQVQRLIVQ